MVPRYKATGANIWSMQYDAALVKLVCFNQWNSITMKVTRSYF
jgi:hypothetical protein